MLEPEKRLARVRGRLTLDGAEVEGYEIHMGVSRGSALARPAVELDGGHDGARSDDGQLLGSYLHGLFDRPSARDALLRWAGLEGQDAAPDYRALREAQLDRLADALRTQLAPQALRDWFGLA